MGRQPTVLIMNLPAASRVASPSPTITVFPSFPDTLGGEARRARDIHSPTLPVLNDSMWRRVSENQKRKLVRSIQF
jgi:hypothetical protein